MFTFVGWNRVSGWKIWPNYARCHNLLQRNSRLLIYVDWCTRRKT
jgi:hypothetical protein